MTTLRKWTKRLGLTALAMLTILAVLWGLSRALYPTGEQLEALAVMQLPAPPEGENAFAALWTLDRDVPTDELARVIELDAARIVGLSQFPDPDDPTATAFVSAAEQYPDLAPSPEDRDLFCNPERENCLEKVAADIATYRALVERNRRLLDRIDALADYDYVRQQLPWNMTASIMMPGNAAHSATRNALWFAEGRIDDALAASCRGIDTWRRLGASGDTLILRLAANVFAIEYHGKLLAEMLAELPLDHALPSECGQALAPPLGQELSLCTAMRGEFEMITEVTGPMLESDSGRNLWSSLMFFLTYDSEATSAINAQSLAPICAEQTPERAVVDPTETNPPDARDVWRFACLSNSTGCLLSSIAAPNYAGYQSRMHDLGARIKLLGTLAWLRENADRPGRLDAILDQRPESLKSPTRRVEIGEDGNSLRVRMFGERDGETWSVPLPAALQR